MPGGEGDSSDKIRVKVIRDKVKRDDVGPLAHGKKFESHPD